MLLTLTPTGTLLCEVFVCFIFADGFFLLQTMPVAAAIMNYFASNNKSFVTVFVCFFKIETVVLTTQSLSLRCQLKQLLISRRSVY